MSDADNGASSKRGRQGASSTTSSSPVKSSHIIEERIDIGLPRDDVFSQWTHYDGFANFTKAESVEPKKENRLAFKSKIGPSTRQWDAEIVEQVPGRRIAWRSVGGAQNMGVITFHELDDRLTRLMVEMEYHPSGAFEVMGNFLRMPRRRVRKDLKLFKSFIELKEDVDKGSDKRIRNGGVRDELDERMDGDENAGESDDDDSRSHSGQKKAESSERGSR